MANVLQLMQKTGLNRNQISKISGISNTYLAKIERIEKGGRKIPIRRKTLINIAVSLNLALPEINALLAEYGHAEVSPSDTLHFLAASEAQTVTGILPLFSSLSLEWFLIGMEKQLASAENARLVYVLDQPSHVLESPEHTHFLNELHSAPDDTADVCKDMVASACDHRRKLITEALRKGNEISTYICAGCLERYLRRWQSHGKTAIAERHKAFLREHMQTVIGYIESFPSQYKLHLLTKCPQLRYELLYLHNGAGRPDREAVASKLLFLGRDSECMKNGHSTAGEHDHAFNQGFGDLVGFATDLNNMLDFFDKQHSGLHENFVDRRFNSAEKMARHLNDLVKRHIA